ncbi:MULTISPECIES: MFS transporter [unclassified Novosphingobium]|uniref:MFS transporter n=1 Tax=unclassified Novosphingobium TaxID=2644732 RepID=UPI0025D5BFA2|nr:MULTISPECIES: MFS transporter [unclassified Novosphingobium]MDR6708624.1 MFS family permease [Novosphingobium sp. 1748]
MAVWSLAVMAHGWVRSMAGFTAARLSLGATEAMGTPSSVKTIARIFHAPLRSASFGLSNAMNSIGAMLAPLAIPFVAAEYGWRAAFELGGRRGWSGRGCSAKMPAQVPSASPPKAPAHRRLWRGERHH